MRKNIVSAEMQDGTILGPERVIFADKMQYERSARANGWGMNDEIRLQGFLTWHALKRVGATSLGYEEFLADLIDVEFETPEQDSDEDPTPADTSA